MSFSSNSVFSHAAALKNTCGKKRVNNHTSLLSASPKTIFKLSTLPWTNSLSPAKPPACWMPLMKCSRSLLQLCTFVRTAVDNMHVNTTDESPRVCEFLRKIPQLDLKKNVSFAFVFPGMS